MENIKNNTIELLSPAGSFECAKAAISAGADAIYMGGAKFGARAFAKSVEEDKILDTISYTKAHHKKFYLTVNTLFKEKELKEVFLYLDDIVKSGVDAFIVQDLGVGMMLREHYKDVELHASTQMTVTSSKAINLLKTLGFKQIVLARELSLKEIKAIKKEVGDEIRLESFVHGSMCYCYSGACLMSSFIGGESGNRGRCKGPCRLPYQTELKSSHKTNVPYILSMKDMCALNSLQGLISAGVNSFKIEGRMRQADYVEGVTKTYRKYIDLILNKNEKFVMGLKKDSVSSKTMDTTLSSFNDIENDEKYLLKLYDKGGFTNYYDKHNGVDMIQKYERRKKV